MAHTCICVHAYVCVAAQTQATTQALSIKLKRHVCRACAMRRSLRCLRVCGDPREREHTAQEHAIRKLPRNSSGACTRARGGRGEGAPPTIWRYGYGATESGRVAAPHANVCDVARAAPPARSTVLAGLCVKSKLDPSAKEHQKRARTRTAKLATSNATRSVRT
eukprot:scaffold637_cov118-Isochrysis_galbana.AAC.21